MIVPPLSPAFSGLRISPNGYLYVMDKSHLDRMPREDLLEGFSALIAICQYFCSPIVGEVEAHKLIIRALGTSLRLSSAWGSFRSTIACF